MKQGVDPRHPVLVIAICEDCEETIYRGASWWDAGEAVARHDCEDDA